MEVKLLITSGFDVRGRRTKVTPGKILVDLRKQKPRDRTMRTVLPLQDPQVT